MLHEICLLIFFFVKKEKKYGSTSACCSSSSEKLILLASSLGGVPVFNLSILKISYQEEVGFFSERLTFDNKL